MQASMVAVTLSMPPHLEMHFYKVKSTHVRIYWDLVGVVFGVSVRAHA